MKLTNRFVIVALGLWFSLSLLAVPPSIFAQTGTWATKASMPTPRLALAVATANGTVYAIGGYNENSGFTLFSTVEAYDPVTNVWTTKAPMPTARYVFAAGSVNGIVYAIGGNNGGGILTTVEAYDPIANNWSTKASMPTGRAGVAVAAANGILYAIGGGNSGNGYLTTVEAYDPVTNIWSTKAPMSTGRTGAAAVAVNGILYAIGGGKNGGFLDSVEAYDPATNTWIPRAAMPTARYGLAATVVNGMIYAVGGRQGGSALPVMEVYDPATNTWSPNVPMSVARTNLGVAQVNGTVYAIGGANGSVSFSTVEAFTPAIAPTADAGPDQTVNEGAHVTLDGSGSHDPNNDPLTYQWTQVSGPPVTLNVTNPVHPTFMAPTVAPGGATLTFQLKVSDGTADSTPDTVNVTVMNVNHPPTADAGPDRTVHEGAAVTLDGSGSFDLDGETLTYFWTQTAGPSVTLSSATAVKPIFTAPNVGPAGTGLTFTLTVRDGLDSHSDAVNVMVTFVNQNPIANAGPDQTKNENTVVTLDGTASHDQDGDPLTYSWSQVSGPTVTLAAPSHVTVTFTAPSVGPGGADLVFRLAVHDPHSGVAADDVQIHVANVNDPPVCSAAQAQPNNLWPPNHVLAPITITGVADPENHAVTITGTAVTQDEPVNGLGDGDTSPDAVLQGTSILLRAERSGKGNGRVYVVYFTADDGQGGTCSSTVTVHVPHSKQATALDSGQGYNSLLP